MAQGALPMVPTVRLAPEPCLLDGVREGLREALRRDPATLLLGVEIGALGGPFQATAGLLQELGPERVVELPLSADVEEALVATAIGMALRGRRPIVELQFADGLFGAFEQLVNELAKLRYRSGGQLAAPLVIRVPYGAGVGGGPYHSQSPEAYLCHTAGLQVVTPSTPADAKGLLLAASAGLDPVVILEPKALYRAATGVLPSGDDPVVLGRCRLARVGTHVTVATYGATVPLALQAAEVVAQRGIEVEVLDLRSLVPLDLAALLASLAKTGRLCIVHEAPRTGGFGAELSAQVAEHGIFHLTAPIVRVAGLDCPVPYVHEHSVIPTVAQLVDALAQLCTF